MTPAQDNASVIAKPLLPRTTPLSSSTEVLKLEDLKERVDDGDERHPCLTVRSRKRNGDKHEEMCRSSFVSGTHTAQSPMKQSKALTVVIKPALKKKKITELTRLRV